MSTDIETAFHTSLDRLLRGEATLDACVAAYPEHDERLRDMLIVALDLQALAPLPLDRQAVERGARLIDDELQRLRARLDQQPQPASAWERLTWWFPRFMPVRMAGLAAAFAIALIAYGGVTLAAVNSGPDSALYGYRLTLEELRIGFAPDEEKAYLYLDTAEQRLREIESAAGVGDTVAVARASTAYQEVVRKGVDVLGAVARDTQPGAERTGEVAANYRRRLAEHDTRFNSLTHSAAEAQRAPITQARSQAKAGLQDVHSGPILKAAPTATPHPVPVPTVVALAPAPLSSPSPTPAAIPTPTASPTPVPPTAAPTAAPTPQVTPIPTPTTAPVPSIDITGSAVLVTGELHAVTEDGLVVAGVPIARGDAPVVDAIPLTARVQAEAQVTADGRLMLTALTALEPVPAPSDAPVEGEAPTTSEPTPTPEPTPVEGTPPPEPTPTETPAEGETTPTPETTPATEVSPTPDASPPATEGQPTTTPEATPASETTPANVSPTPDASPTPSEGEPAPTPEASPTPEPTPTEGSEPTGESQPPPDASPTPTEGEPTAAPEASPSPDAPPAETPPATEPPQLSPEASPTPTATGSPAPEPQPTPEPSPDPTPADVQPSPTPEPTTSPEPTPTEGAPSTEATPPATTEPAPTSSVQQPSPPPTLQGFLVSIDSFSVRAGGIVFSRPLDTPLVLRGPMTPGGAVLVTFEALRAASSYVLVAREVAPVHPLDGTDVTRWQGFVDELEEDGLTVNGVRVQVTPEARQDDAWASLEIGALVEIELGDATAPDPLGVAVRLLGSGAAQSFSNLADLPRG